MKKIAIFILLFFGCKICIAQNLVPNGDFEQFYRCPNAMGQIDSAKFWFPATGTSPDYFNQCATGFPNIPNTLYGFQQSHSGNGFAGISLRSYFEYIEVPLNSMLLSGNTYHFEMYVNLASRDRFTTDDIGVYFSDTAIRISSLTTNLTFMRQITNTTGVLFDTLMWTLVSGDYTALGGEKYIILGNFKDNASTNLVMLYSSSFPDEIYVYIDDVSLVANDVTGIKENEDIVVKVYPSPFAEKLNVKVQNNMQTDIILYDLTSKKVLQQNFINYTSINTEQLPVGVYFYEIKNNNLIKTGKIIR